MTANRGNSEFFRVYDLAAARRLPLTTLGLVQYLSPTLTLLLGVWVLGEAFDRTRQIGFVLIWVALAIYSAEALRARR